MKDKLDVSLTSFIDYIAASAKAEVSVVSNIKQLYENTDEQPFDFDYYRPVRKAIFEMHRAPKLDPRHLLTAINAAKSHSQVSNFEACINGYRKWMGRKSFGDIAKPQQRVWETDQLRVRLNPEFILNVNGKVEVFKLYYKDDPLNKIRVNASLHLLHHNFGRIGRVNIMDLRRGRPIAYTKPVPSIDIFLSGKAASFAQIWRDLDRGSAA